jgi:hypothetical protein
MNAFIAISFYAVTLWIVGAVALSFLIMMAAIFVESGIQERRLRRMRREADLQRDRAEADHWSETDRVKEQGSHAATATKRARFLP